MKNLANHSQIKNFCNTNKWKLIILVPILLLLIGNLFLYNMYKNQKKISEINIDLLAEAEDEKEEDLDLFLFNKEISYFKEEVLIHYSKIQSEINSNKITKLYSFISKDRKYNIWIAETINQNSELSHYFISPTKQRKLEHVMSSSSGEDANCDLVKVQTIGNKLNTIKGFKEFEGYLILSSINCKAYGGGNSVSIYSLKDGEKLKVNGNNFTIPGTTWKGISDTGNILGRLKGIYGMTEPTLVIDYGGFESSSGVLSEVKLIGYFDLQTGKLLELREFN